MNGRHSLLLIATALAIASLLVGGAAPALADQKHGTGTGTTTQNPMAYLEPGEHTITRPPSVVKLFRKDYKHQFVWEPSLLIDDHICPILEDVPGASVGYVHNEDNDAGNWCAVGAIFQEAVKFDYEDLRSVKLLVADAHLQYDETMLASRGQDGQTLRALDCAERYATPTVDWTNPWKGLVPNVDESYSGTRGNWDVRTLVQNEIGARSEDNGILLRGTVEGEDEDNAACMSQISNIRLVLHYFVLH